MAYRDILLALVSYPDATPDAAIDRAVRIARRLGGHVTALGVQIRVEAPRNALAEILLQLEDMAEAERAKSAHSIQQALARFRADADAVGLDSELAVRTSPIYQEAGTVVRSARTRDVTIIPVGPTAASDRSIAERLLLESGRPVLVAPETGPLDADTAPYHKIAIAWDGSRCAARAVGDALPLLAKGTDLRVLAVLNEKPSVVHGGSEDLVRHLERHGLTAGVDEVDGAGREIASVFQEYVEDAGVELLVMGGFAHSRARELILGGATSGVLERPFAPTLMAH